MNKKKLTEGQYIIRGSLETAILYALLALPVVTNIVPPVLGFPLLMLILLLTWTLGYPPHDQVELSTPRWRWNALRYLVTGAFALLAFAFYQVARTGAATVILFGEPNAPLVDLGITAASQGWAIFGHVMLWFLPSVFASTYLSRAFTRKMFGQSQLAENA